MKKKLLSFLFVLPLVFASIFMLSSCGEESLSSITLTLSGQDVTATGKNTWTVLKRSKPYQIDVKIVPDKYSVEDLTLKCTPSDVATITTAGALFAKSEGWAEISAQYKNTSGDLVYYAIRVYVSATKLPSFATTDLNLNYEGVDLLESKSSSFVPNNMSENYECKYYEISKSAIVEISEIVNVGEYVVECVSKTNSSWSCGLNVHVLPATIPTLVSVPTVESVYGDESFDGVFASGDTIDFESGISLFGVGKDEEREIGKCVFVSKASLNSGVGSYPVEAQVEYSNEQDEQNYKFVYTKGTHTISQRKLAVKVLDKEITYGDRINQIEYELYDNEKYIENGCSFEGLSKISSSVVSYVSNVSTSNYVLKLNNAIVQSNSYGQYDVLWENDEISKYDFAVNFVCSGNVKVENSPAGKLTINPKDITVTPTSRSKIYGERDEAEFYLGSYSNGIVDENEIEPFIFVIYNATGLGEGNMLAPVGTYYYSVDNSINKNYNFTLCEDAKPTATATKIVYEVIPVEIVLQFQDLTDVYYTKTESAGFSGEGYVLEKVASLKISNEIRAVNEDCSQVFSEGKLVLVGDDKMEFKFGLSEVSTVDKNSYKKFKLSLQEFTFADSSSKKENYRVTLNDSYITTKRETLTVIPNINSVTGYNATKTYDGESVTLDDEFYKSFTLTGHFINGEKSQDVLSSDANLLTLQKNNQYVKVLSTGEEVFVSEMKDCGKYKIMLNDNVTVNSGMEHYELVLDTTQKYCFEITQMKVQITLNSTEKVTIDGIEYPSISKVYGQDDPMFNFKVLGEVTANSSGNLSREKSGKESESVGNYLLSLGDASLGGNYIIELAPCYLVINPREVLVTPTQIVVTYGSDIELNQYSYEISKVDPLNESLINEPTFSGMFVLQQGETVIEKQTYYKVGSYNIAQGSFVCNSKDYTLKFGSGSSYTVNPKQTVLDILPTSNANKSETTQTNASLDNSQLKLKQTMGNVSLSATVFAFSDGGDNYFVDDKNKITLEIKLGDEDVTSCYEWSLGKNVAYYFGKSVIELKVVKIGENVISATTTYTGETVGNLFELKCVDENYSISSNSNVDFNYINEQGKTLETAPIDAGNYSVVPVVDSAHKLIIEYIDGEEKKTIEFSSLPQTSDSFVARLLEEGTLTIQKADIKVVTDKVQFTKELTYGATELPDIELEYSEGGITKYVFTVVEAGETKQAELKTFDEKHYVVAEGVENVASLSIGEYRYKLVVQPEISNFNSMTIYATLVIVAKEVKLTGGSATLPEEEKLVYDGTTKNCVITPTFDFAEVPYKMEYSYLKLKAEDVDGVNIKLKAYSYVNGNINFEESSLLSVSEISSSANEVTYATLSTIEGNYVVLNNSYAVELASNKSSPQGAGAYLCVASISADSDNYRISRASGKCEIAFLYEIKKNGNLTFTFGNKEFYYGTNFNMIDQERENFPFECEVSPNIGDSLVFIATDNWGGNDILSVGTYQVKVKAITPNFYKEETFEFTVKPCIAEIEFPQINSYAYTGYKIDSYFSNIKIKLYNYQGEITQTTTLAEALNDKDFLTSCAVGFSFFQFDNDLESYSISLEENKQIDESKVENVVPVYVGKYLLKLTIGGEKSNYYGTGEYKYSISKPAYSGEMKVETKEITYNPNISPEGLYNIIRYGSESKVSTKNGMFKIDLTEAQYTLDIYVNVNGVDMLLDKNADPDDENNWVKHVMTCKNGGVDLRFVVTFIEELNFAPKEETRKLTVRKMSITKAEFSEPTGVTGYYYNGREVYHALKYKGFASLDKVADGETKIFASGNDKIYVSYFDPSKLSYDYAVTITDKLGNEVGYVGFVYFDDEVLLKKCPIAPSETYKVEYYIHIVGDNYEGADEIRPDNAEKWENSFRINKIDISIMIEQKTEDFSGSTFSIDNFVLTDKDLTADKIKVTVSSKDTTDLKVTMVPCGEAYVTNFNNTSDIVVFVRLLYDDTAVSLERGSSTILQVGEYKVQVSLLKSTTYDITKFFGKVSLYANSSANEYTAQEIVSSSGDKDGMYNLCAYQTLTITPVQFKYETLEDMVKANRVNADGTDEPIAYILRNGKKYFYSDTGFLIQGDKDDEYEYVGDGDFLSDNIVKLDKNTTIELSDAYKEIYQLKFYYADSKWETVAAKEYASIQALVKALEGNPDDGITESKCVVKFVAKNSNFADSDSMKFFRIALCPWEVNVNLREEVSLEDIPRNVGIGKAIWNASQETEIINGDSAEIETSVQEKYIVKRVKFYNKTGTRCFTSNFYRVGKSDDTQYAVDAFMLLFKYEKNNVYGDDGNMVESKKISYAGYADDETKSSDSVANGQFSKNIEVIGGTDDTVEYFIVIGTASVDGDYTYHYNLTIS